MDKKLRTLKNNWSCQGCGCPRGIFSLKDPHTSVPVFLLHSFFITFGKRTPKQASNYCRPPKTERCSMSDSHIPATSKTITYPSQNQDRCFLAQWIQWKDLAREAPLHVASLKGSTSMLLHGDLAPQRCQISKYLSSFFHELYGFWRLQGCRTLRGLLFAWCLCEWKGLDNGISWWYLLRKKCVSLATWQSRFLTHCHSNGPQFQDVVTNSDPRRTSSPSCTSVVHVPCQPLSTHLLLVQGPMGQGSCAII